MTTPAIMTGVSAELSALADASTALLDRHEQSVMNTFGRPQRVFVRGEGCYVWDADGRRYLDLLAGIAVNALGHAHPTVLSAITGQIATLGHVSNFFATPAQVTLAERLTGLTGDPDARVFFTNSGTEANEAAFKLTRRTGRRTIISTEGAFHGRSLGALAITHNPAYREPFEPLPGNVIFVPYGDADALAAAMAAEPVDSIAAVVLEPIQGENGVIEPPADYLPAVRARCDEHGSLLWLDEVQTGMGRTGDWFAHTRSGVRPDVITLAKGLGNGFPVGACLALGRAAALLGPGHHGTTFGGNPVAAIAGLAVMAVIERDGLLAHVQTVGDGFATAVTDLNHPMISSVRGRGLMRGIVLAEPIGTAVVAAALDAGFVINAARPDVVRLVPPLVITADQLQTFVAVLPELLDTATGSTT